jgi:hypothetical protein
LGTNFHTQSLLHQLSGWLASFHPGFSDAVFHGKTYWLNRQSKTLNYLIEPTQDEGERRQNRFQNGKKNVYLMAIKLTSLSSRFNAEPVSNFFPQHSGSDFISSLSLNHPQQEMQPPPAITWSSLSLSLSLYTSKPLANLCFMSQLTHSIGTCIYLLGFF